MNTRTVRTPLDPGATQRSYAAQSRACPDHPHCQKVSYLYYNDSCDTKMGSLLGTDGVPLYERRAGKWYVRFV